MSAQRGNPLNTGAVLRPIIFETGSGNADAARPCFCRRPHKAKAGADPIEIGGIGPEFVVLYRPSKMQQSVSAGFPANAFGLTGLKQVGSDPLDAGSWRPRMASGGNYCATESRQRGQRLPANEAARTSDKNAHGDVLPRYRTI